MRVISVATSCLILTYLALLIQPVCPTYDKAANELEAILYSEQPFSVKKKHMDEFAQKFETNPIIWRRWERQE